MYQAHCVRCHEQAGGIGPALHPEVLFAYGSPQRLVDYIKLAMPYDSVGSLNEDEYWDVVAHLLDRTSLRIADGLLDKTTAAIALREVER